MKEVMVDLLIAVLIVVALAWMVSLCMLPFALFNWCQYWIMF